MTDETFLNRLKWEGVVPADYSFNDFSYEFNNLDFNDLFEYELTHGEISDDVYYKRVKKHFKNKFNNMSYGNRNYSRSRYRNDNYNHSHASHHRPRKKRSGAKCGVGTNGKFYVSAWNASRDKGLIVVSAFENKKSKKYEVKSSGKKFTMMIFEIVYRKTGNKVLELASFCTTTNKVYLKRLGMVISCNAPNGGYMGQIKRR